MSSHSVFISYAREDSDAAERLFRDLSRVGISAWLDKEVLLPGMKWKVAIAKAIRSSRFFIALLSTRSVSRKGYVHSEMQEALEVLKQFPEDQVFVIPARLDDCQPAHERLSDIHRVDLFPDWNRGVSKILQTIGAVPGTDEPHLHAGRSAEQELLIGGSLQSLSNSEAFPKVLRIVLDRGFTPNWYTNIKPHDFTMEEILARRITISVWLQSRWWVTNLGDKPARITAAQFYHEQDPDDLFPVTIAQLDAEGERSALGDLSGIVHVQADVFASSRLLSEAGIEGSIIFFDNMGNEYVTKKLKYVR